MNAYTKLKRSEMQKAQYGERCRLHIISNQPLPYRFAAVWPRSWRNSGFVVNRYDHAAGGYVASIETNSFRRARAIAKRFVEGKA